MSLIRACRGILDIERSLIGGRKEGVAFMYMNDEFVLVGVKNMIGVRCDRLINLNKRY